MRISYLTKKIIIIIAMIYAASSSPVYAKLKLIETLPAQIEKILKRKHSIRESGSTKIGDTLKLLNGKWIIIRTLRPIFVGLSEFKYGSSCQIGEKAKLTILGYINKKEVLLKVSDNGDQSTIDCPSETLAILSLDIVESRNRDIAESESGDVLAIVKEQAEEVVSHALAKQKPKSQFTFYPPKPLKYMILPAGMPGHCNPVNKFVNPDGKIKTVWHCYEVDTNDLFRLEKDKVISLQLRVIVKDFGHTVIDRMENFKEKIAKQLSNKKDKQSKSLVELEESLVRSISAFNELDFAKNTKHKSAFDRFMTGVERLRKDIKLLIKQSQSRKTHIAKKFLRSTR